MANIELIIKCIDSYLDYKKVDKVSAVEAARILDRANILHDNSSRPGLPLRNLLRDGKIPHAYQLPNGRNGRWFIPHS